jgi:hypothetical protein
MERIIDAKPDVEFGVMTAMILSIPQKVKDVEAIIIFPGMGESWLITDPVKRLRNGASAALLIIAGQNPREKYFECRDETRLRDHYGVPTDIHILTQIRAQHTKDQADWVAGQLKEKRVTTAALSVSPFHIIRAYLTVLASLYALNLEEQVVLIPAPVRVNPSQVIPETGADAWDMCPAEWPRIANYQKKGDVASLKQLKQYLGWLWRQQILTLS